MEMDNLAQLRTDCETANKLWGRTFSSLSAITYREKGEDAVCELYVRVLRQHQTGHYREGLQKLGIRDDEPPAVAAAKYHYLTNAIGGLSMEYIEESPKKVWIRYIAPMWTFAGTAMIALPSALRRKTFTAWHPRNGQLMGCPRLGWVSTKFIMEAEPCDEGYFIEYDHDLRPGEEFRYEAAQHTPEFEPAAAPRLDPLLWPVARMLKARRNWSRQYVRTTVECLLQMFGEQKTYFLFGQVMRMVAIQYTHELKNDLGAPETDAASIARFLVKLLLACGQQIDFEERNGAFLVRVHSFLPFDSDTPEPLKAALFEFQAMTVRLINGRVSIHRQPDGKSELWKIEDAGRWLW